MKKDSLQPTSSLAEACHGLCHEVAMVFTEYGGEKAYELFTTQKFVKIEVELFEETRSRIGFETEFKGWGTSIILN